MAAVVDEDEDTASDPPRRRRLRVAVPAVLVGLAVAWSPAWLPGLHEAAGLDLGFDGPVTSIVWNAVAASLLLTYVLLVERRPLGSIGLTRPKGKHLEWALTLFGVHMGWSWLVMVLWPRPADVGTATITAMPVLAVVGLILSAAVFEEILYRGYPIERVAELTGRRWIAVALTAPVFVAPHLTFFGTQWLLYSGSGTLVIYVLYLSSRNLPACMLLHLAVNLPILIPTIAS